MLAGQPGAAGAHHLEQAWREHATPWPIVRDVLALDAFSRCWIQEGILFARLRPLLPADKQSALERCAAAWREQSRAILRSSVARMASYLLTTAADREVMAPPRPGALGRIAALAPAASRRAMQHLRERLETRTRELVDALVVDHGLDGRSRLALRERLDQFAVVGDEWLTPGRGAILGGAVSGALGGLAADAAAAGLTFGGGAVLGAILGALGGAGLAAGYRLGQGERAPGVSWAAPFLGELTRQTVLRYLAVAHFGRGRGGYADFELPARWTELVAEIQADHESSLAEIWSLVARPDLAPRAALDARLAALLEDITASVLTRGYPDAAL
jgi:hypothetical protein